MSMMWGFFCLYRMDCEPTVEDAFKTAISGEKFNSFCTKHENYGNR